MLENLSEITDTESDDSDYMPENESVISDYESDVEVNEFSLQNISNISTTSTGESCIKRILQKLKEKNNKHNWRNESLDSFVQKYLSSKKGINKVFNYELDVINDEIEREFGKNIFHRNDKKLVHVNKLFVQLRKMPQLLKFETSDEENIEYYQPKTLFETYEEFLLRKKYPKEYLAAPICDIGHFRSVKEWEKDSPVAINLPIPFLEDEHIIFNYPEMSSERNQIEMRTFDYMHILNNLHFHVCNKGFRGVSTEAFIEVSKVDHDVLPQTIVEDKMDRQNSTISQCFFAKEVEEILISNGNYTEEEFVQNTRNWFRACDDRGMEITDQIKHLNTMYEYMVGKCNFSDYPLPISHVEGIPIKTYEALLHTISTRFSLFGLSASNAYNTRSISTLAVESFFSDLTKFEFSGLGAPKVVDIPKLISHVVHINSLKYNPDRGFEFTTSTCNNYPTILMDVDDSNHSDSIFKPHNFDVKIDKKNRNK